MVDKFPEIHPVILQLLYNRDLSEEKEIDQFLNPNYEQDMFDPFLFKDMKKAVARIFKAIEQKEKIVIHGDYDADGVSSAVILFDILKTLGADSSVYLPHREREGYGLKKETVEKFATQGIKLIITCDCGISNKEEVALAYSLALDVIITDHHEPPSQLPSALAILNPRVKGETYPFKELAGSGVAFKLACALIKKSKNNKFSRGFEKWILDVVAIGTVADIVALRGENRTLVKFGLIVLEKTKRPGLKALLEIINNHKRKIDTFSISFQIAPRINAAGRMDHALLAFQLLTAKTQEEAKRLARKLQFNNQERQRITEIIVSEVKTQIGEITAEQKVIIAKGQQWPAGIIGLVAGKIADEFYRPVLILTEQNGTVTGSGRSIREFNIVKALEKTQIYCERWGGHSQACGFTLKRVDLTEKFQEDFEKIAYAELAQLELYPFLEIESEVKLSDVTWDFYELLAQFPPFGEQNPKPLFVTVGAQVTGWQRVGVDGQHLKLMLNQADGESHKTIGFNQGELSSQITIGDLLDVVFELGANEWNGKRELELKIIDFKKSQG